VLNILVRVAVAAIKAGKPALHILLRMILIGSSGPNCGPI